MINSRSESIRTQILQFIDALLIWLAFMAGWMIRNALRAEAGMPEDDSSMRDSLNWILYIAVPLTPLTLERLGFYDNLRTKKTGTSLRQMFQAMMILLLVIGLVAIFTKQLDTRRLAFGAGLLASFLLINIRDLCTRIWYKRRARDEDTKENIVIAGTGSEMQDFINGLSKRCNLFFGQRTNARTKLFVLRR